jgi:hypothetical protein
MTYASEVLADSAVSYYQFEETSGTSAADSSGNGFTATYVGSPTFSQTPGGGLPGTAVRFGTSTLPQARVTIPTSAFEPLNGDFTIEAVVKVLGDLTSLISPAGCTVYSGDAGGGIFTAIRICDAFDSAGAPCIVLSVGGGTSTEIAYPNDQAWHHVAVTWKNSTSTAKFYIDGVLAGSDTSVGHASQGSFTTSSGIAASFGSNAMRGALDEVAFYHTELSSTRIGVHYSAYTGATSVTINVSDAVGITDSVVPVSGSAAIYEVTKPDTCGDPSYHPDGELIVFQELIGSTYRISRIETDGTNHTVLKTGSTPFADPMYSDDGNYIVYSRRIAAPSGPKPYGEWALES